MPSETRKRCATSARRTLAGYSGIEVRKCSAYDLPWKSEFDIAFSIGVMSL